MHAQREDRPRPRGSRLAAPRFRPLLAAASLLLTCAGAPLLAQSPIGDPMTVGVRLVADGFTSPVQLVAPPDGSGRLFVVDQVGLIWILDGTGARLPAPFLDWRARLVALMPGFDERGLLGLAFHPDYASNGRFFLYYSAPLRAGAPAGFNCTTTISELRVSSDPDLADPASETILLQVDKPQFNHNGGTVAFGPDGNLYVSIGDGGGANDVGLGHVEDWYPDNGGGNGQDVQSNLLGNLLRIDVDGAAPYAIPPGNPFAGGAGCADGCDEIYAYGFRNPYRFSFDMASGALLVGDAGQGLWEEVSLVTAGGNYGWNVKEGSHCFDAENNTVSPASCPSAVGAPHPDAGAPLLDPVIEYANSNHPDVEGLGVVVVGGHVYRGRDVPQLRGRYVFGDFSRGFFPPDGTLLAAKPRASGPWQIQELRVAGSPDGRLHHYVLGFGQDAAGEIYVLTSERLGPSGTTGRVHRLTGPGKRPRR